MDSSVPPPYSEHDPHPRSADTPPTGNIATSSGRNASPQDPSFISGAAYFAMRPPQYQHRGNLTPTIITLLPDSQIQDLPLPTQIQKSRADADNEDWFAFLNHLIPTRNTLQRRPAQFKTEKHGTITATPAPLVPPTIPSETHLKRVVEEWNRGFFLPRGISIVLQTQLPPTPPSMKKGKAGSKMGEALYEAVKAQDTAAASLLLSHGADLNYKPSGGTPQIVLAVKNGNTKLLQLLLERGPNIEANPPGDGPALWYAIKAKNVVMIQLLLLYGASANNAHPSGGQPALYRAVHDKEASIVKLLLTQPDIDIEKKPPGGGTSLYKAAKDGDLEMVKLLLSHGAKAECKEHGGATAMHRAAERGDMQMTQVLLEGGANVDATPPGGNTALREATKNKDLDMVGLLLQYGADINKKRYGGSSALTWATKEGEMGIVEILLGGVGGRNSYRIGG